ncbi:hypothetical protein DM02DRAFT_603126 [Periconia macrospinosa]|uniref:Uncharacterized protein n=1 Tax=Periconia macrospinosa TaxID=97972 RepID=A0A2V1D7J7_9PLEO|nr:hypothetical protein DM02DRAFT_603126 [Periconia macrospinosa]
MTRHLGLDEHRLLKVWDERSAKLISVAFIAALPGVVLLLVRSSSRSWTARYQISIANALHIFALITIGYQALSVQELLIAAWVMVLFEVFEGNSRTDFANKMVGDAPCSPTQHLMYHDSKSVVETLLSQTHSVLAAKSSIYSFPELQTSATRTACMEDDADSPMMGGSQEEEAERLRLTLTEARTALKVKEIETRRLNAELQKVRKSQNDTYAEYANLREEMKSMKQSLGRDHQAAVYRKDIELFAMRKASEQKENYIKDRESKLQEIYRSQKTVLELKDAQIRNLKEKVASLERSQSPQPEGDSNADNSNESGSDGESQSAIQVKLFRVQGRSSVEIERAVEEKDMEIAKLKLELSKAAVAVEALNKTQDELKRAWDATFEAENALNEERKRHTETQLKLRNVKKVEEEMRASNPRGSLSSLPTIDEQDKKELEAMFNAAQEDNLRLYAELETFEKRIQNANTRVFQAEQEVESLKEQLKLEKAINEDLGSARPSLVHRVHFQRMEGQLKEIRDALEDKKEEIAQLTSTLTNQDCKITELSKAKSDAEEAHMKAEQEKTNLQQSLVQLESTKDQLMLDHERLAKHRHRQRTTSAERTHTSARSSGATLITDPSAANEPITSSPDDPPLPARPVSLTPTLSIQRTPERHVRSDTANRPSLITNDVPPAELRSTRRKSLTIKSLMKKLVNKDDSATVTDMPTPTTTTAPTAKPEKNKLAKEKRKSLPPPNVRPRTATLPKGRSTSFMRPKTAVAPTTSTSASPSTNTPPPTTAVPPLPTPPRPVTATPSVIDFAPVNSSPLPSPLPPSVLKQIEKQKEQQEDARPKTAASASVAAPTTSATASPSSASNERPQTASTARKSEGGRSSRYYEMFGDVGGDGIRPMTATSVKDGKGKEKEEKEKGKRPWSGVSKKLLRRSAPPLR